MAMWYKLTSNVILNLSIIFFFRPRGRFVFQSKISGKFFEIHILYLLFDRTYHILDCSRRSVRSPQVFFTHNLTRSPPFELRAPLSERLKQANHILFTSLSLYHLIRTRLPCIIFIMSSA